MCWFTNQFKIKYGFITKEGVLYSLLRLILFIICLQNGGLQLALYLFSSDAPVKFCNEILWFMPNWLKILNWAVSFAVCVPYAKYSK